MSRYNISTTDLLERFELQTLVDLTDGSGVTPDPSRITSAITAAEDEFDGYLGVYYTTPVRLADGTVPPVVRKKLLDAISYELVSLKPLWIADNAEQSSIFLRRRKEVLAWLEGVSSQSTDKRILLLGALGLEVVTAASGGAELATFDDCSLSFNPTAMGRY